jgi:WhiB family redox-sensing transcriptional regulator
MRVELAKDWAERAACKGAPLEIFVAPDTEDAEPYYLDETQHSYCDPCPVRVECLQWALDAEEVGVWGGTTTYQRRQLGRTTERLRCPGCASQDLVIEGTAELCLACGVSWYVL